LFLLFGDFNVHEKNTVAYNSYFIIFNQAQQQCRALSCKGLVGIPRLHALCECVCGLLLLLQRYLPATRKDYGISSLDGGAEYYRSLLRWHLSIDLDPDLVFDLGVEQVDRIRRQMENVS